MTKEVQDPLRYLLGGEASPARPDPTELWHFALHDLGRTANVSLLHSLDVDRIRRVLKTLYWVGEQPGAAELRSYIRSLWPRFPGTQKTVRDVWRTILRNPHHRFRAERHHRLDGLHKLDQLAEEHDLRPLEERLDRIAEDCLAAYLHAVRIGSPDEIPDARRDLHAAMEHAIDLRHLRHGPASVGRWWDNFESSQPPPGTRGYLSSGGITQKQHAEGTK